jgi:short-subunit dehydrogenase
MTNTLRYELSPLGVSVTLLTLGAVQTGLHSNERPISVLDKKSYYAPIVDTIEYETSAKRLHSFGVPREGVAREIVKHVLNGKGKDEIWLGGLVWVYYILRIIGLLGLLDWLGARERGCKKLVEARGKMKNE